MNGYVARHISVLGPFVPLPLQEGRLSEGAVLRRHWLVPVRQTPRERQVCLAADRGWQDASDAGPAHTAHRGDGLAADGCCGSATKTYGRWLRKNAGLSNIPDARPCTSNRDSVYCIYVISDPAAAGRPYRAAQLRGGFAG